MARRPLLTDEEILARARPVFVEHGYAARTRQVARAVGLTWGAIALRFGSKQALFNRAMAAPDAAACDAVPQEEGADLPCLLYRLRTHLWERWPQCLQLRLSSPGAAPVQERDLLLQRLAVVFAAQARCGAVRDDIGAEALAGAVLSLLTGDVAQRFVAGEHAPAPAPGFIEGVVRLLSTE